MNTKPNRLYVVDALRGFAIVSIMLLHNIEHFDFYFLPTNLPAWMVALDKGIWDTLFFLFRGRFAWRLVLLLGFGLINSAFYEGDILQIYAMIGFFLIPVAKLSNKAVFWIAVFLMVQPYEWFNVLMGLQNPAMAMSDPQSWAYFGKAGEYITGPSIVATGVGNLTNGKTAVLLWTWEQGRVFQ